MSELPRPRRAHRAARLGAVALASALVVGLLPAVAGAVLTANDYVGTTLTVTSDDADDITIACVDDDSDTALDDLVVVGEPLLVGSGINQCAVVTTIVVTGGGGVNTISVDATTGVGMSSLTSVSVSAGNGDDVVTVTGSASLTTVTVNGDAGIDTLQVVGSVPTATINGGVDNDTITVHGNNVVNGGAGNDVINVASGASGAAVDGGLGTDRLSYSTYNTSVTATINGVATGLVSQAGIENLSGGLQGDDLTGDGNGNTIVGGAGTDTIDGGLGADTLQGDADADTITFGLGDNVTGGPGDDVFHPITGEDGDSLDAGSGTDTIDYSGFVSAITANLTTSTVTGVAATLATNLENVTGGDGNDTITGSTLANVLLGGLGSDTLSGGLGGADTLTGGATGGDTATVLGTSGADVITASSSAVVVGAVTTTVSAETIGVQAGGGADAVTVTPDAAILFTLDGGAQVDSLLYQSAGVTNPANVSGTITADDRATVSHTAFEAVSLGSLVNVTLPTVSGTAHVGQTLTATAGSWVGDPTIVVTRQWVRCDAAGASCVVIPSQTGSTYVLATADIGHTVRHRENATNPVPSSASADSAQTAVVADVPGTPAAPGVATGQAGQIVVTFTAPAANSSAITGYVVRIDGAATQAATGSPFTVTGVTPGVTHTIEVAATNAVGTGLYSPSSIGMAGAVAGNTVAPSVSGTATVGSTLTATVGTWSGVPAPVVTRQWQRCNANLSSCTAIAGATGTTYVLTTADLLARVRVVETGTNLSGAVDHASSATAAVLTLPSTPAAPVVTTGATGTVVITWSAPADGGSPLTGFEIRVNGGAAINRSASTTSLTIGGLTPGSTVSVTVAAKSDVGTSAQSAAGTGRAGAAVGYWMLERNGFIYRFGAAADYTGPTLAAGVTAVDAESTPSGNGLLVLASNGAVYAYGDAPFFGGVDLATLSAGERVSSISVTPSGGGYWVFTNRGRVVTFGNAPFLQDLTSFTLNGPVLDAVPTPSGLGYYMVGSDGGVFSFGDAVFYGSMGGTRLNKPVAGLVPDPDGVGYWLVATDGGVFAFDAGFRGSMGGTTLNAPVNGMIAYGNGYLMVASDGGVFNFATDLAFQGSLGATPPANPIVAITAVG